MPTCSGLPRGSVAVGGAAGGGGKGGRGPTLQRAKLTGDWTPRTAAFKYSHDPRIHRVKVVSNNMTVEDQAVTDHQAKLGAKWRLYQHCISRKSALQCCPLRGLPTAVVVRALLATSLRSRRLLIVCSVHRGLFRVRGMSPAHQTDQRQ